MIVEDEFRIRLIEEDDLAFVKALRADPSIYSCLGTFCLLNDAKQKKWFDAILSDNSKSYMIFEKVTEAEVKKIGMVRITDIDYINRSMCVGGDIAPSFQGKGYSKKMYSLIFKYGFGCMNMHRLYLSVLETNLVARSLYEKMGFVYEGTLRQAIYKDGKYLDYYCMSILRDECNFS